MMGFLSGTVATPPAASCPGTAERDACLGGDTQTGLARPLSFWPGRVVYVKCLHAPKADVVNAPTLRNRHPNARNRHLARPGNLPLSQVRFPPGLMILPNGGHPPFSVPTSEPGAISLSLTWEGKTTESASPPP